MPLINKRRDTPGDVEVVERDDKGITLCRVTLSDSSSAYDVRIDVDDQHVVIDAQSEEHALDIYDMLISGTDVRGW